MKINNVNELIVKYNDVVVGYLKELKDRRIAFQYSKSWIKNGFSISPLSLPLKDEVFISQSKYFNGLFGVFNDSLPDGWGELLFRRMLVKNGINIEKLSPLTRLSFVNSSSLGALRYYPINYNENENLDFDLDKLYIESSKIFKDENVNDLDYVYKFGGSSGGARPKVHIKHNNEEWIVKFPCSYDPIEAGVEEYKINELAKKCDINVNECELFKSRTNKGYFGCKRFDRDDKSIHMISLSSLLETTHKIPNLDYSHLFQVIRIICNDEGEIYEAFKRMCFNVLIGNKDDHGRNFSFLYDEKKKSYVLSPFYDITETPFKLEHEMTVNNNGNPSKEDIMIIAKKFELNLEKCDSIYNKIKNTIETRSL